VLRDDSRGLLDPHGHTAADGQEPAPSGNRRGIGHLTRADQRHFRGAAADIQVQDGLTGIPREHQVGR
jgi:hypothetical protein